jgi:hypothetical protein
MNKLWAATAKLFTTLLVVVFLLIGLLISANIPAIGDIFDLSPVSAKVSASRTIVSNLQPLGQLVTTRAEVAHADVLVSINAGIFNLCGHAANHVSQGVVEAGIDFSAIEESDVSYDETNDQYTLQLPPPILTSCRMEYIRQYDRSNTFCNVDWDVARRIAEHESMEKFALDMVQGGILDKAKLEATVQMSSFVSALTGSSVIIGYDESSVETGLPKSCQPDKPNGWDKTEDGWQKDNG